LLCRLVLALLPPLHVAAREERHKSCVGGKKWVVNPLSQVEEASMQCTVPGIESSPTGGAPAMALLFIHSLS
jgi:hypothetical protein